MMYLKTAQSIADRIVMLLQPHCEIVHIAGSIRREKRAVKDIEIVCQPKVEEVQANLLETKWQRTKGFSDALEYMQDHVVKGNVTGRYMQIILKGGSTLDLFMPQKEDFYRQLAIRTGSSEYSNLVIAHAWKRLGWCGTHDGLRLQSECQHNEKTGNWKCAVKEPTLPPVWENEQAFFTWLGVNYFHPSRREIPSSVNIYK